MVQGPVLRPLTESLRLAAEELEDLCQLGDKLERMVTRLSIKHGVDDAELTAEGQAADLLSQRLAGLTAFIHCLAEEAPTSARADILPAMHRLTLAEQARRLSGPGDLEPGEIESSGELLLFTD